MSGWQTLSERSAGGDDPIFMRRCEPGDKPAQLGYGRSSLDRGLRAWL
jgi:hypothetical protein